MVLVWLMLMLAKLMLLLLVMVMMVMMVPQADRPECLLSPSSRQHCGYCSQPHHRHLPPSESQRAWDEHHYNLPRLFLPLRRRGLADGAGISTATGTVRHHHTLI